MTSVSARLIVAAFVVMGCGGESVSIDESASTGVVKVTVTDEDDQLINNVQVTLTKPGQASRTATTQSGSPGTAYITALTPGVWSIVWTLPPEYVVPNSRALPTNVNVPREFQTEVQAVIARYHVRVRLPTGGRTVQVKVGELVSFANFGSLPHSATSDDGTWNTGYVTRRLGIEPPQQIVRRFLTPGTYRFYCMADGAPGGRGEAGILIVSP